MDFFLLLLIIALISDAEFVERREHFRRKLKRKHQFFARQNLKNLQVTTQNGVVEGFQAHTVDTNKTYYTFHGIPYAQAPIGDLRFQPPVPASNWEGVYDATYERSICVQGVLPVQGSEDCLYINVYTPEVPSGKNLSYPVMMWIHGGGFVIGDGNYATFGPDYLLDEDVIVVTLNYRLGVFGFLSTEDLILPGNNGLKDQILALKWIQRNIAAFGGEPNNLTLFGESAGAASITYLILSPLTKGLYKRAILQSGTSLGVWALSRKARQFAFATGRALGIFTSDSAALIASLKKVSYQLLQGKSTLKDAGLTVVGNLLDGVFLSPVKEPEHDGAIITSDSYELLTSGQYNQIPVLTGFNSEEINYFASLFLFAEPYIFTYDLDVKRLVPIDMNIENIIVQYRVGLLIKQHYTDVFGSFVLNNTGFIHFASDDLLVRPIREYIRIVSKKVDTYYYEFSYEGRLGNPNRGNRKGVAHTEDLNYIFRTNTNYDNLSKEDRDTRYRMVRMWTNFAKFGNPTPVQDSLLQNIIWSPASTTQNLTFLNIGANLTVQTNPRSYDMNFWDYLYKTFSKGPYDTY